MALVVVYEGEAAKHPSTVHMHTSLCLEEGQVGDRDQDDGERGQHKVVERVAMFVKGVFCHDGKVCLDSGRFPFFWFFVDGYSW